MNNRMIPADVAMLKVLEAWNVKDLFGYPAGSLNSLMNALDYEKKRIDFIQVRHEQVGALAASAQAKLTHHLGVAFGSAGPGAVNMLNGLYDAKEDHAPVLAIVGQSNSYNLNYDYFQEFPEAPIFSDVSCYDRVVMNTQSLPHVVDRAVREAYHHQSVAVVVIPNDLGFVKIPDRKYDSAPQALVSPAYPTVSPQIIKRFKTLVNHAQSPVFKVGRQIANGGDLLKKLSRRLQIPIMIDGPAKGLVTGNVVNAGTGNRITSKVTNEIMDTTDLIISLGSEFSFSHRYYERHPLKYVQVDRHRERLGYHHTLNLGVWSDPTSFIKTILKSGFKSRHQTYYSVVNADIKNEHQYQNHLAVRSTTPLTSVQVYHQINRIAKPDAIFSVDIGDNTVNSFRYLRFTHHNRLVTSAHFATMGCSIPGAIAAKLANPHQQVFSIAGDGALSMVMQDLVTERKYHLPIINVVTTNHTTNYIKSQQANLSMKYFGVNLTGLDFKLIANGMGIEAINVTTHDQIAKAFNRVLKISNQGKPVLINVVITNQRSLPMEKLHVTKPEDHWQESASGYKSIKSFFNQYHGHQLKSFPQLWQEFANYRHK